MPIELRDVIAAAALVISAFLAWLRFQDWRARPNLRLDMDWMTGGGGPTTLRIAVGNRGKARGGVRDIVLSSSPNLDDSSFGYLPIVEQLPVMLDPGHFVTFRVTIDPNGQTSFTQKLLDGTFTHAILVDQDERSHPFRLPERLPDSPNRISTYGRVAKR